MAGNGDVPMIDTERSQKELTFFELSLANIQQNIPILSSLHVCPIERALCVNESKCVSVTVFNTVIRVLIKLYLVSMFSNRLYCL